MSNKITFGLSNVHYAIATLSAEGVFSWGSSKPLVGAQELTADIIGGKTEVYGDDQVIGTLISNSGKTISLKMSEISDEFKKDIFGWEVDSTGNLVEVTNSHVITFALGYEVQGDVKARRVWYYLCTATPVGDATKSKTDSAEPNSSTLSVTARPIEVGDKLVLRRIANKEDANYDTFLSVTPVLPVFGV